MLGHALHIASECLFLELVLFGGDAVQSYEVLRNWDYRLKGGAWGSSSWPPPPVRDLNYVVSMRCLPWSLQGGGRQPHVRLF